MRCSDVKPWSEIRYLHAGRSQPKNPVMLGHKFQPEFFLALFEF